MQHPQWSGLRKSRARPLRTLVLLLGSAAIFTIILYASKQIGNGHPDGAQRRKGRIFKTPLADADSPGKSLRPECADFPDTSNILLVMKTKASEAYSRIPMQLMTNLKCVPDFLIFGDMAQVVAGQQIHDSLDSVLPEAKTPNHDFDLYNRQHECAIDHDTCNRYHDVAREAQTLDKYKNVHIAEKAYRLRPSSDWYLFVDTETYVVWPTLVEWLRQLDPLEKHYIGSLALHVHFPFAQGGSGYLLSQGAMQAFFKGKSDVANKWDTSATEICCGDALFGRALKSEADVGVTDVVCSVPPL